MFKTISDRIILRMINVLNKSCRQKQNTHFMFRNFSRKSCRFWDNIEKYGRFRDTTNDNTLWRVRFACWISKATRAHAHASGHPSTHTHANARAHTQKYVIFIAFPRQQWFHERASMLRYTYVACIVELLGTLYSVSVSLRDLNSCVPT